MLIQMKVAAAVLALGAGTGTYVVQSHDTLSGIAQQHHESLQQVEQQNPQIRDFNEIYTGELIHLGQQAGGEPQSGPQSQPASPSPAAVPYGGSGTGSGSIPAWATCIVERESGGNPRSVNAIPGYIGNGGGLFGDLQSTWNGYDGYAQPFDAPVSVQVQFNNQLSDNGANLLPWAADGCKGT